MLSTLDTPVDFLPSIDVRAQAFVPQFGTTTARWKRWKVFPHPPARFLVLFHIGSSFLVYWVQAPTDSLLQDVVTSGVQRPFLRLARPQGASRLLNSIKSRH